MKGQAFITLPSEDKAKRALKDAHGYILHGKPMVIVSLVVYLFQWDIIDPRHSAAMLSPGE